MRSDDRRAQILEEATRFFSESGLSGNTRELSARLGITQPALSYQIKQLEDELGAGRLLVRGRRAVDALHGRTLARS